MGYSDRRRSEIFWKIGRSSQGICLGEGKRSWLERPTIFSGSSSPKYWPIGQKFRAGIFYRIQTKNLASAKSF